MKRAALLIVVVGVMSLFVVADAVAADCWGCDQYAKCKCRGQNLMGWTECDDSVINECDMSGSQCTGTGEDDCDSGGGDCPTPPCTPIWQSDLSPTPYQHVPKEFDLPVLGSERYRLAGVSVIVPAGTNRVVSLYRGSSCAGPTITSSL